MSERLALPIQGDQSGTEKPWVAVSGAESTLAPLHTLNLQQTVRGQRCARGSGKEKIVQGPGGGNYTCDLEQPGVVSV